MERLTAEAPPLQWELHQYRYRVAAEFTQPGDTVLDAACGIGYGRFILQGHWIGVDRFDNGQVSRKVDLESWRPDFDYDVFVGLETIEHLASADAYVAAAQRARRAIVISTPIIPTVHFNQYHLRDYSEAEVPGLFPGWKVAHFERQVDPVLGCETYGIWAFTR